MTRGVLRYLIMDCASPYNVLIGRPPINEIGAVVPPMHLKIKYLTPYEKVCVLAGEQKVVKACSNECEERYVQWGPEKIIRYMGQRTLNS